MSIPGGLWHNGRSWAVSYSWNGQTLVPSGVTVISRPEARIATSAEGDGSDSELTSDHHDAGVAHLQHSGFGSGARCEDDGCLCLESAEGGMDAGIWDGVTMMWVCTAISPRMELQDFSLLHADYIYLWDEQEREFVDGKSSQSMHWKFSRNFLASKSNHGHWTIEGDIPVRPFPHLPVRLLSRPARDFLCVCLLSRSPW